MRITQQMLIDAKACNDQIALFKKTFPGGATWPDDVEKAGRAGLDVSWAAMKFKLSGRCRRWHDNGQLKYDENFERGKLHGRRQWWDANGQLRYEVDYERGKLHGRSRWWDPNGQLWYDVNYEHGIAVHGACK